MPKAKQRKPGYILPSLRKPSERSQPSGHHGRDIHTVFLYVIYCVEFAKIGITQWPEKRVQNLQASCPFPIKTLITYPLSQDNAVKAERSAMLILNDYHHMFDWFKCEETQAKEAAATAIAPFEPPPPDLPVQDRRSTMPKRHVITPDGEFESARLASEHYGIGKYTVLHRIKTKREGWQWATVR